MGQPAVWSELAWPHAGRAMFAGIEGYVGRRVTSCGSPPLLLL